MNLKPSKKPTSKPRLFAVKDEFPGPRESARLQIKSIKPSDIVQCNRCGGREFIETKTGALFKNGKTVGGFKNLICLCCLLSGTREQA